MPRVVFPDYSLPSSARVGPSLAGFVEAQETLRARMGVDAVFLIRGEQTWPPDTPLDPETGRPFDPFLEPDDPIADAVVVVRCSFVSRPVQSEDPAASPIGAIDRGNAALIVDVDSHALVADAYRVRVGAEVYDVQDWRWDSVAGMERWIAYLEHA